MTDASARSSSRDVSSSHEVIIRCMCGKRYRIRQATAGLRLRCPECDSLVEVTSADLETSFSADGLINLHEDQIAPQDAILIADEGIRLAAKGSRPGVTGEVTHLHEEAALAAALGGSRPASYGGLPTGTTPDAGPPPVQRTFVNDLVASFWFAGNRHNAMHILLTALPMTAVNFVATMLPGPFVLLVFPPTLIFSAYIIQYYWLVLQTTTRGEDEIPWFETDWNMWDDVIRPCWWIGWISFVCSLPCILTFAYVPAGPLTGLTAWGLLAAGWFFWPVAVMSYALGRSFFYFRPDWLVRCIAGIGPSYVVAWALVMLTIASWYGMYLAVGLLAGLPSLWLQLAAWAVAVPTVMFMNIYFGYVLFRMLGLLFRHHRERLPWKF